MKVITVEQADKEDRATFPSKKVEVDYDANELGVIEEEDRDGSSRREDDDFERGFSLSEHSEKNILAVTSKTEKSDISLAGLADRKPSTSLYDRRPYVSLSINEEDVEESPQLSPQEPQA